MNQTPASRSLPMLGLRSRTDFAIAATILAAFVALLVGAWALVNQYSARNTFSVLPSQIDLGDVALNDERHSTLRVANHGEAPIRIVGAGLSCTCFSIKGIPVTIAPHAVHELGVTSRIIRKGNQFTESFDLFVEVAGKVRRHTIGVTGRITKGGKQSSAGVPLPQSR